MVEIKELSEDCSNRKKIRQAVSVPFLWEEKPGMPKKDWKPPSTGTVNPVAPPPPPPPPPLPVKLVASVPFKWEEQPGKPLPCFFRQPSEVEIQLSPENLIALALPLPPVVSGRVYCQDEDDNDDEGHINSGDDNESEAERYKFYESDVEAWGFETDESFRSVPSLTLAVSSNAVVPVLHQTSSSPASETDDSSSTSSYATGTTSLVGAAFLECLFPLLSPNSSFLGKLGCPKKFNSYTTPMEVQNKDFDWERNCSVVVAVGRPQTLGELIMMSRRRSYRRKAVQMRTHNLSIESMKKTAIGCSIFGINNWIEGLQRKWKNQLRLKLI